MEKLIVLGTNYYQSDLVKKARELGYETHLFGIGTGTPAQQKLGTMAVPFSDHYYPISVYDKEAILKNAKSIKPVGIVSIAADTAVQTWAYLAQKLGLVGNTPESALVSTDKHEMKKRFKNRGAGTTDFIYTNRAQELPFPYPAIVKAVDRSGKMGIIKVERQEDLADAIEYGIAGNYACDKVLVEKFAEGREYSAECITFRGKHVLLNFTEKWNFPPNYVEEMHLQPAPFDEATRERLRGVVFAGLSALDIQYGASHTEFKIDEEGNVNIIEIAARMAAENMWDVVEISTGLDYIKAVIDIAVGNTPNLSCLGRRTNKASAVKYLIAESDFANLAWIEEKHPEVFYKRSPVIEPFTGRPILNNADRYGFYILDCGSREEILGFVGNSRWKAEAS